MLEQKIIETIDKYNLIESGDKIVLGVSGGPDSICMLNILNKIKNDLKFDIVVAHINHGIRENAKYDEEYVKKFCEKIKVKCFILHAKVKEIAEKEKRGIEETGRIVRYNFFDEIMHKTNSNKIAIAHNANDNAETIIMNMIRGSGTNGLKGIDAKNGVYIRPLIKIQREDIEKYCKENNLKPRHDESNDENIYTRNKIRNIAIPYIKLELNPNIIDTLNRLSDIAKEELDYIKIQTEKVYEDICLYENILVKDVYNKEDKAKIILDTQNESKYVNNNKKRNNIDNELEKMIDNDESKVVILNLKKFNEEHITIQKRIILYSINKLFGSTKGIEKIHIDDIIKLCNNNIGNKFLTPNKKIKIVIKNKKIYIIAKK